MTRLRVDALPAAGAVLLSAEATHHALHVRRLEAGAKVVLFDGAGREVLARLQPDGDRWCALLVEAPHAGRVGAAVTLCFALPKGDRLDTVVRQTTELGVGRVLLMSAARSVVRLDAERARRRRDRLARIASEAARQSGRSDVPSVDGPLTVAQVAAGVDAVSRWVLHPRGGAPLSEMGTGAPAALAVGPEGGFDDAELAAFDAAGWRRVTLNGPVLRTETAAVVGCALALHHLGAL